MAIISSPTSLAAPKKIVSAETALNELGVNPRRSETLPFVEDATAGSETELHAAVIGSRADVDLPLSIEESNYFANAARRAEAGDTPRQVLSRLENWLDGPHDRVWDDSWVRVPLRLLSPTAREVLHQDLLADKSDHNSSRRSDSQRFFCRHRGEERFRGPMSYLLKLALADILDGAPTPIREAGKGVMSKFINDNTSPETISFRVVNLRRKNGFGRALSSETAIRFLFSQVLTAWANDRFELAADGQKAVLYASPHPPVRQRRLNDSISDAFYRELFMSPCLSGWDRGESKRDYMALCHQTLSRSQLNAVGKLREAGVITRNLVVLPNTSHVGLANNGTHVSLGSRTLSSSVAAGTAFGPAEEKLVGDLAIKVVEHFLPLFVGAYSAAPYRLDFEDFHPEQALGFLPHQLDYTHLRMLWRRWRGKARNSVFGQAVSPVGPEWIDHLLAKALRLRGDIVPDFRLIDYFVCPMSTERSPSLDGILSNHQRLLEDLDGLGIFDSRMALYQMYRQRTQRIAGYSGFEGRCYSLFPSYDDMRHAVNLQALITALAYRYIAAGRATHADIPDRPFVESERRQIVFGSAIGIPTFFVESQGRNRFLLRLLEGAKGVRRSHRYPGRLRVEQFEYRRLLLKTLRNDAQDIAETMGVEDTLSDLERRVGNPKDYAASEVLIRDVLAATGAKDALALDADEFNLAAERYYRQDLSLLHLAEGLDALDEAIADVERMSDVSPRAREVLQLALAQRSARDFLASVRGDLLRGSLPPPTIATRRLADVGRRDRPQRGRGLSAVRHQYIGRESGETLDERLFGDRIIGFLYSQVREQAPGLLRMATSRRATELLGLANFDSPLAASLLGNKQFLQHCGVDLAECVDSPHGFRTPRQVFERRIRYWETRPMEDDPGAVVSPADARVVLGSFSQSSGLYVKGKFFDYAELIGESKALWLDAFHGGDFAVFRLTPDKYHYNHAPVAGRVVDFYELTGRYHSCNPSAVVEIATPLSKNKRTVTVIDTDVYGGTRVGLVAMVEVTALMIGVVVQCYSHERYDSPRAIETGMFLAKGLPKSLYRPGSSTDILIFQSGRVAFADDLLRNQRHASARSRFSLGFGQPLVETDVRVRSSVAQRAARTSK